MGINIGDKNKIKNTTIINSSISKENVELNQNWFHRHPLLTGVIATLIGSVILSVVTYWDRIKTFAEQIFGG